jgi:hypothetical protein
MGVEEKMAGMDSTIDHGERYLVIRVHALEFYTLKGFNLSDE